MFRRGVYKGLLSCSRGHPLNKFLHNTICVEKKDVSKSLGSLGLSKIETDVYLYVSSNPETTAGQMTKNIKIARSKTYEALNKLTAMGLISKISREDVSRYYSSGSSVLKGMYSKQMEDAKKSIEYISKLDVFVPSVTKVRLVEGIEGYRMLKEAFVAEMKNGSEVLIIGSPAKLDQGLINYFEKFHKKRMQKNIQLRVIYNADVKGERLERAVGWKNTQVRCLPKNNAPAWIEIYGNRALITLASNKMVTIAITDESISTSFRNYFEILWKSTKKPRVKKC